MSSRRILFLDRDGTLNEEVADEQIDSLAKIRLMPGVIPALLELKRAGFSFVVVTNQDGLGTARFPQEDFDLAQRFILELFSSQGVDFEAVFLCPHFQHQGCNCRKPQLGMVEEFLRGNEIDKANSFMIGDRATDMEFAANLGITGLKITLQGEPEETWPRITARSHICAAAPECNRFLTRLRGRVTDLRGPGGPAPVGAVISTGCENPRANSMEEPFCATR